MNKIYNANLLKIGIILVILSNVSACGQKGDLYLPPKTNYSISVFLDY